ncbi:T9SS type B sorting domain-containing protein [Mangrovimonas futianensis]|nr:T9SS type B sorting domain-containing protein [Mangrovimonas futianensis]MCF1196797.1 T9SS type B sorting domain-containing protein [Mangrovimonas futianensis]
MTIDPLPTISLSTVLTKDLDCTANPDAIITGTITGSSAPYTYAVSINGGAFTDLGATGTTFTYSASTAGTYQFQITDANGCTATSPEHTINPITPPAISLIAQTAPILCNGDTNGAMEITIDDTVGTPPFTINVFNDTTGTDYGTQTSSLPAGSYTVTVTDANSCTGTDTIVIDQPDPIDVTYHAVDITCTSTGVSQGSIIVDGVTGGTAPYNYFVTGTNGYENSELNATGSTSVSFDVVDFGLYQINVIDANGCSVLVQDVLVASPPTDLDITVASTVDCSTGGTAVVSVGSTLSSAGPFYFSIYQGPISEYPNPAGSWIPEDAPGSQSATFTGLTPGVSYTFIVYDESTNCSYFEPATTPIPTNSSLTATAVTANNITCSGSDDGNVTFTINSVYGTGIDISYEVFDTLSLESTGVTGSGSVPSNGSTTITDLGPLPFGNYYVLITENTGPNAGCSIVTIPFNITQSEIPLTLTASVDQNANCNPNSGVISAIAHDGTAPYLYQITTTPAAPDASDSAWASTSTFNVDAGTYYVHTMDAYGCIVTVPVDMISDPAPIVDAVATNPCTAAEGGFEIEVTMPTAGVAPYSFSINGGAFQTQSTPFTISNLYSGTHTVEVQDANGCGNLVSVTIEAPLGITPEATALPSCNDDDGVITVTGTGGSGNYTYTMNPNPASVNLSGNVFSGVPAGMYTITITDTDTGCSEEVGISLPAATPPSFTTVPTAVTCYGDSSGAFDINVSGYSGSYTYEVFDNNGVSVTGAVAANTSTNPITVTGMAAGTFTVEIIETESPFCSTTSTVVISSPTEALDLVADITSDVTCDNTNGTINVMANGGWGDYQYELTGDATVAYSTNNNFTELSAGSYTVNVMDAGGCIASVDVVLSEPEPIAATMTPSATMLDCFGDQNASITVENVTGGQGSNYTYTLNMTAPTASSSGPQTSNVFANLGAGTYTVTVTDGYNCEFVSGQIVIDQPEILDAALVTESTATCLNDAQLTLSATGGTPPYTYSSTPNGTSMGTFNTSVTFSVSPGTHQFYVQDANGCTTGVTNEITIEELPDLVVNLESTNPTINCAGDNTGAIVASAQGGLGDYVYTLQDTSGNTINAVQNTPGVFTELLAGTYVVQVESGDCLATTANITITEPQNPLEATFEVNDVTCFGSSDGSIVINATGGTGIIMYAISPQMNQFFQTNVFEDLAPGDYEVIVQDELGCYLTFEFSIAEPEPVIIGIVPDSMYPEVCAGDQDGEFSIEVSGGTAPYSVSLDSYDGPYTQGAPGQTQFEFTGLGGGDHIVYVRDSEGCESEWNITFPEAANIQAVVTVEYLCVNNLSSNTVTVTVDETLTDISQLDYSLDGGPYQMSNVFNDVPPGVGHYIEVRHTNGCIVVTDLFDIEGYDPLALVLVEGDMNEIIAQATGGNGEYEFTFNGEDYGQENSFMITQTGTHTVTVTDSAGCTAMATIYLEFIDPCIPNYFTPNGDGVADTWGPDCVDNYPDLEFSIFDRYGRKIVTLKVGQKWDGKYDGKELPTGDYWYVVNLNSAQVDKDFVGHFTLYR